MSWTNKKYFLSANIIGSVACIYIQPPEAPSGVFQLFRGRFLFVEKKENKRLSITFNGVISINTLKSVVTM